MSCNWRGKRVKTTLSRPATVLTAYETKNEIAAGRPNAEFRNAASGAPRLDGGVQ